MSEKRPDFTLGSQDFSPGYIESPEPDTLPPGATVDAKNCLLVKEQEAGGQRATLRRRYGSRLGNPIAISSGKSIDGIWQFDKADGTSELVVMCDGALYVWDGASAFTAVTNGGGFTAGTPAHARQFKNNLHVTDGTQQLRYDGVAAYPVGFAAPTAAPALATAAGPGVTGTYEGFAVWYDSVTGHESSPSAVGAQVVFANEQRQWTKPAGAPPANVTHWRIYCRRVDTDEVNYFRTGLDQTVATATYTEAIADAVRRDKGPDPDANDVPPVFDHIEEFKQYRLGVLPNSSDLYVSAIGDAESQHPDDVFPVGGRGDAKAIRSTRKYGQNVYLRKPTRAYTLVGDKVPFQIVPAGEYGAVSFESGVEVEGLWYDWDEQRGPYVTDMTSTWTQLADKTIKDVVATVNRVYLSRIRAELCTAYNLILWAVPTSSSRKRTILAYNYNLKCWLPPITGMEYSCLSRFTTTAGALGVYFGDEWGRVYELFSGEADGPPGGTTSGSITAATANTIDVSTAAFYTTGSGLAGMPVAVRSPAGAWQWARILSNTGTRLTLDTTNGPQLSPVPDPSIGTWTVIVGGIEWYWTSPRLTGGNRRMEKRGRAVWIEGGASANTNLLEVYLRYNRSLGYSTALTLAFPSSGLVWGVDAWGSAVWGVGGTRTMRKHRLNQSFFDVQVKFQNYYPGQPFEVTSYGITADAVTGRFVSSF